MQCPFCGQDNDKVVDSRASEGGRAVRRRRHCLACNKRFTTYEHPEEVIRATVIKRDESREPYQKDKIIIGLQRACYKRPVSDEQILHMAEAAEEEIFRKYDRDVPALFIGEVVCNCLREVDKIAYVRFASVYRRFTDVGEFIEEAQDAIDSPRTNPNQKNLFDTS